MFVSARYLVERLAEELAHKPHQVFHTIPPSTRTPRRLNLRHDCFPTVSYTSWNPGPISGTQTTLSDERGAYLFTRLVPGRCRRRRPRVRERP